MPTTYNVTGFKLK